MNKFMKLAQLNFGKLIALGVGLASLTAAFQVFTQFSFIPDMAAFGVFLVGGIFAAIGVHHWCRSIAEG